MTMLAGASVNGSLDHMRPGTLLALDRFARIVSYSPILFNQVVIMYNELQRDSSCSDPVLAYTWQYRGGGRPGREEFANAIQQAEDMIYRVLNFSVAPRWFEDEIDVGSVTRRWSNGGFTLRTNNFHLIEPGVEKLSYLAAAPPQYTDEDGDGYAETARIVLTNINALTDANEIAVFPPGVTDPAYEVRPIRVTFDNLNNEIIITVARHLLVRADLQERLDASGIDGMEVTNFYPEVEVYRRYSDVSEVLPVEFEWPCGGCGVCTACGTQTATGCFRIINPRNGLVQVYPARYLDGAWVTDRCLWVQTPARIRLKYRAGFTDKRVPRPMADMAPELERAVAFLALSYLDRDWLTCEQIRNLQAHWRFDLAKSESNASQSSSFRMDADLLMCPLGTTRAALYAWRVLQPLMVGQAVLNV